MQVQDAFVRIMRFIPFALMGRDELEPDVQQYIGEALGFLGVSREDEHLFYGTREAIPGVNYGNANNVYNPDENINDQINNAVARRKEWMYEHEPSINGKTREQRIAKERNAYYARKNAQRQARYEAEMAEYRRRTRKGAVNPYAGPRERRYTRYGYNSNDEGSWESENSRNYYNRMMAANAYNEETGMLGMGNDRSNTTFGNNNNDEEYPFAEETRNMSNAEFEKWLREHVPKQPLEKTISLNKFFNENRKLQGEPMNTTTRNFFTRKNEKKPKGPVESAW
jgi:hypothetical protein